MAGIVTALGIPDLRFVLMIVYENPGCFMNKFLSCEFNCLENTICCFALLVSAGKWMGSTSESGGLKSKRLGTQALGVQKELVCLLTPVLAAKAPNTL